MGRRFRFFSFEALRSIRSNAAISLAATATVLIAIATLGIFLAVFSWTQSQIDTQKDKLDLRAFIKDDVKGMDLEAAIKAVEDHPDVTSIVFKTKAQVLEDAKSEFAPEVLKLLATNPLPATIVIQPNDPQNIQRIVDDLKGLDYWLKDDTSPTGFDLDQETTQKFLSAAKVLRWGAFGLMVVLVIAAVLLIGNTIRLSIFARRREVEVMRLVGATNWFIRWPFVIEGLIFGLVGAIAAVILLVAGKLLIIDNVRDLQDNPLSQQTESAIGLGPLALILIVAGAALGAIGSGITLRRFLKV